MDDLVCGFGEQLTEMFSHLQKLKPSFGSGGRSSSKEDNNDDDERNQEEKEDQTEENQEDATDLADNDETNNDQEHQVFQAEEDDTNPFIPNYRDDFDNVDDNNGAEIDEQEDEEDVDKMLRDMRISDFNLSIDFDEIQSSEESPVPQNSVDVNYMKRMQREEVYSKKYHPDKDEAKELQDLATSLGVSPSSIRISSSAIALHEFLFGNHSIVLKKGPIYSNEQQCVLYLLTDGFILAYQKVNSFNPLGSRYEACQSWSDMEFVEIAKAGTLVIQMQNGEAYDLHATSGGDDVKTWLLSIEQIVVQQMMHDTKSSSLTERFGWQHTIVRRPGFTAAVMGDIRLMGKPREPNQLDGYNHSSPLHYAVRYQPCSAEIVEALLEAGSDPNFSDGEGRTAMYFAQRNHLDDIEMILKEYGGKSSTLAEMELRGELFGGVEEARIKSDQRREQEQAAKDKKAAEANAKAQSAQSQMGRNMAAMIERGEKIEQIDDKARELNNEAKNFRDMAAQLKNNVKNKKWYQL